MNMSSYYDFSKCIICRSKMIFESYNGDFEVTALLNRLYLSLMQVIEKRKKLDFSPKELVSYLKKEKIVDVHGNEFNDDDIARYLRNALAHYNIEVTDDPYWQKIEQIRLWGINIEDYIKCKEPCSNPKCKPKQYKFDENDKHKAICTFTFTVPQLQKCVDVVTDKMLNNNEDICKNCKYLKNDS